jgi:outer membrane protein
MLKSVLGAVLTLLVCPFVASAQPSVPFAYFSPQRAFAASPESKTVETRLNALQATRSKELDSRNQRLKVMQDALERSGTVLSPTVRQEREREIERFQVDIQRFIQDAQNEFLGVRKQSEDAFVLRLQPALAAVAKEKGLLFVINEDQGLIAWADPVADITPEIIRRLEPLAAR